MAINLSLSSSTINGVSATPQYTPCSEQCLQKLILCISPLILSTKSHAFLLRITSQPNPLHLTHSYISQPRPPLACCSFLKLLHIIMDSSLHKITILLFVLLAIATPLALGQGTRVGFYLRTCSRAESIVQSTVKKHVQSDSTVAPGLLRMIFHDCFVHGCDASILIDGASTEKTAGPNLLLRGYQVIDDAKTQLETACPGVVSCADILALAARDAAVLAGALTYLVPTGRRDGLVSLASDTANLPSFTDSVDVQKQKFSDKGLSTQDLVTLVGGHTIGTVACQFIRYRFYNFTTSGGADPSIDPTFLPTLQSLCPANGDGNKRIGLDDGSSDKFDHSFFTNLRNSRGILESDQRLWADASTKNFVQRFIGIRGLAGLTLNVEFGKAMIKMSNIEVKTGTAGEIRKVCSAIN